MVQSLHTEGGRVTVLLHTDSRHAAPLRAQVTRESAELMGLVPGQAVLAMAKATAVQVLSGAAAADGLQATVWNGEVTRADTGEGAEVAVRLPGGVHVVGFAVGAPLQPGAQVQVRIPAAAVVLALVDGAGLAGA